MEAVAGLFVLADWFAPILNEIVSCRRGRGDLV
jgi:hypothetical protein